METKIEELLGVVESKNVKILEINFNSVYDTIKIKVNDNILGINYVDNVVSTREIDYINFTAKQFNFIVEQLFGDELALLEDMVFNGQMSIKTKCVLLKGATFDVDSAIVPTENGTMQYRVSRSFKNGKLSKDNVKTAIKTIKSFMD